MSRTSFGRDDLLVVRSDWTDKRQLVPTEKEVSMPGGAVNTQLLYEVFAPIDAAESGMKLTA
jgi:hypothetical protein